MGLEGILLVGSLAGFATTYHLEQAGVLGAAWAGLAVGILAGMAMGSVMAILAVCLKADQVVAGVTGSSFCSGKPDSHRSPGERARNCQMKSDP